MRQSACAICGESVAATEGVACAGAHFTCSDCLCRYVSAASEAGAAMGEEQRDEAGHVISAAGALPCPLFPHSCADGELSEPTVANLLAGARTAGVAAGTQEHAWRSFMAAKARAAVASFEKQQAELRAGLQRQRAQAQGNALATATLRVQEALLAGHSVPCPGCAHLTRKDDACIHMDCACGMHFCYVCGRDRYPGVRGTGRDYRAENKRDCGCDWHSPHLERQPGWSGFGRAERGESAAHGALIEFHRRRMAFFVRAAKESVASEVWLQLQQEQAGLLEDVIEGRSISWAELDAAEHPQIGAGNAREAAQRAVEELVRGW